jgi:tripartite-type tricarboxylate transporter receptor subunit TctC
MLTRRRILLSSAVLGAVQLLNKSASALEYPRRPVKLIVPSAPGGTPDLITRLLAQRLTERLGQTFIIDNRPGAGGNIAADAVLRAPPDGHTLLWLVTTNIINSALGDDHSSADVLQNIAPIINVVRIPLLLLVTPDLPVNSAPEFISYVMDHRDELNFGSNGIGTPQHVTGELFKMLTGTSMIHVPYRGSPQALTDLVAGRIQVMFDVSGPAIEFIKAGKLKVLAVTTEARASALPDVPPLNEFVPGFEASTIAGLAASRGTPADIIESMNSEVSIILSEPETRTRLNGFGITIADGSSREFFDLIASERIKWKKVAIFAGLRAN